MTYSVVAKDPRSDMLGVAVVTRSLSVGASVPWVVPGVGAVATQADNDATYGPALTDLLKRNKSVDQALRQATDEDDLRALRQLGIVDNQGNSAAFTGTKCIAEASHVSIEYATFQANMMARAGVPDRMCEAWLLHPDDPFERRLFACLEAGQAAGGDIRGKQSAAMLVRAPEGAYNIGIIVDLRVDDHTDPLAELERLIDVSDIYRTANDAQKAALAGDFDAADEAWQRATRLAPHSPDVSFWHGVYFANTGRLDEARDTFAIAFDLNPELRELLLRLPASGALTVDAHQVLPV